MKTVTRARISDQLPSRNTHLVPPPTLGTKQMEEFKRLAGFCLAPADARAAYLGDDAAGAQALETLKPSLSWSTDQAGADILVGNGILQDVFTRHGGSWSAVRAYLTRLVDIMPVGGRLVLRENALLVPEEMVFLELPDHRGKYGAQDPSLLAVRRLQAFAKQARPWLDEPYRGFFLEEMPAMKPDTRLFNLHVKWAAEFLMRKDLSEDAWEESLQKEYILGNERVLRLQLFNPLGLRVILNAPYWDRETYDKKRSFQLYKDDGHHVRLPPPPNEMVIVAEKTASSATGLRLSEQRASHDKPEDITLVSLQSEKTGETVTIVAGLPSDVQVLPWRYLDDGRVGVYLRREAATPMVNVKPRTTSSIDGRRFGGYLPMPLSIAPDVWDTHKAIGAKAMDAWLRAETGLAMTKHGHVIEGKMTYPAPDFIDQIVQTLFIEVKEPSEEHDEFVCYDANDVLQAIHAGLLPIATLEAQLWQLAELAKVHLTMLVDGKIDLDAAHSGQERIEESDFEALCRQLADDQDAPKITSFKPVRGGNSDWRIVRSTFHEETSAGPRNAIDAQFVLSDADPLHKAALFCLSRSHSNEVLAGFQIEDCPVPTRHGQSSKMMRVPMVPLPNDLRSVPDVRAYLAEMFEVDVQCVVPCGQAVMTHTGVTPQKIFPFLMTNLGGGKKPKLEYFSLKKIRWLTHRDNQDSILWVWGLALAQMCDGSEFNLVNRWENRAANRAGQETPTMQLRLIGKNLG